MIYGKGLTIERLTSLQGQQLEWEKVRTRSPQEIKNHHINRMRESIEPKRKKEKSQDHIFVLGKSIF